MSLRVWASAGLLLFGTSPRELIARRLYNALVLDRSRECGNGLSELSSLLSHNHTGSRVRSGKVRAEGVCGNNQIELDA